MGHIQDQPRYGYWLKINRNCTHGDWRAGQQKKSENPEMNDAIGAALLALEINTTIKKGY